VRGATKDRGSERGENIGRGGLVGGICARNRLEPGKFGCGTPDRLKISITATSSKEFFEDVDILKLRKT
jgi:hypothetical protein